MRKQSATIKQHTRAISMLIALVMLLSIFVPISALAEGLIPSGGEIWFSSAKMTENNEIDTGVTASLRFTVPFSADLNGDGLKAPEIRIYLGDMKDENFVSIPNGGKIPGAVYMRDNAIYTVKRDENTGELYLLIQKCDAAGNVIPWSKGETKGAGLNCNFDIGTKNGTEWNVRLVVCESDGTNIKVEKTAKLIARANTEMHNSKTSDVSTVVIKHEGTTLGKDITYHVQSYVGKAMRETDSVLAGEEAVSEYTVTDILTLPNGLYIDSADIQSAVVSSNSNCIVTPLVVSAGKVSAVKITCTKTNSAVSKQIENFIADIKLNGNLVKVDNTVFKTTGSDTPVYINNTIETEYKTIGSNVKTAAKTEVNTRVYKAVAGAVSDPSKTVAGVISNFGTWNNGYGYLVENDYVLYKISFGNSSKETALTNASVTDEMLADSGLELVSNLSDAEARSLIEKLYPSWETWRLNDDFVSKFKRGAFLDNNKDGVSGLVSVTGNKAEFTNISVPGGEWFNGYVLARLTKDQTADVKNIAKVKGKPENPENPVECTVKQQSKSADITVNKQVRNISGNSGFASSNSYESDKQEQVEYVITVKNTGSAEAKGVRLIDKFPVGYIEQIGDCKFECTNAKLENPQQKVPSNDDGSGELTVMYDEMNLGTVDIQPGGEVKITIEGTIKNGVKVDKIINTASAIYNNSTSVAQADLNRINPATGALITKVSDKEGQYVPNGEDITYTITVDTNGHEYTADEPLIVRDSLPAFLEYKSSSITGMTTVKEIGSAPDLAYSIIGNGTAVITIVAAVAQSAGAGTLISNTAFLDGGSSASAGTSIAGKEDGWLVKKTASVTRNGNVVAEIGDGEIAQIKKGDKIDFFITVTNNTGETSTGFILEDTLIGKYVAEDHGGKTHGPEWAIGYNWDSTLYPIHMEISACANGIKGIDKNYIWGATPSGNEWNPLTYITFLTNSKYRGWAQSQGSSYIIDNSVISSYGVSTFTFDNKILSNGEQGYEDGSSISRWQNPELSIPDGGWITLKYSVTAADSFTAGSNTAKVNASSSTVRYSTDVSTPAPTTDPDATQDPNATPVPSREPQSDAKLSIDKKLVGNEWGDAVGRKEWVCSTSSDLKNKEFSYSITLKNESDVPYTTTNATLIDQLPKELRLKKDNGPYVSDYDGGQWPKITTRIAEVAESESYKDATWNEYSKVAENYNWNAAMAGNWIAISLSDANGNSEFTLPAKSTIVINMYLKISPDLVAALETESGIIRDEWGTLISGSDDINFAERSVTNVSYFTGDTWFKDIYGNEVRVISDVETIMLRSQSAHPGLEKKAFAFISESGNRIGYTELGDSPQPGARLIWKIKVQNDKDSNNTGLPMKKYVITDVLPERYAYLKEQKYTNSNEKPVSYPSDLAKKKGPLEEKDGDAILAKGIIKKHKVDGTEVEVEKTGVTFTENGRNLQWSFDATRDGASGLELQAGEWLEFTFITEPTSNLSGIYYNSAELRVEEQYNSSSVILGTAHEEKAEDGAVDKYISDGDSFSLSNINTKGQISVNVGDVTAVGGQEGNNILEVPVGTTRVNYELRIDNIDPGHDINNISVINRLPYVGDSGVIVSGQRGSEYDAIYANNMRIVKHTPGADGAETTEPINDYSFTTYSGDAARKFDEHSDDWENLDADGWSNVWDNSTKLIRVQLGKEVSLADGEYITIEYDVDLPAGSNESMTGWNGFAYHFSDASGEMGSMAAEPASVAVKIPANGALSGEIRVKKVFASDRALDKTFYFVCIGDDGKRYGDVQSVRLNSSGDITAPVNADITFVGLPYTAIGKSVGYTIYESDKDGNILKQGDAEFVMYTGMYRTDKGESTAPSRENIQTLYTVTEIPNKEKAGQHKDLSANKTSNSAIFSNIIWSKAKISYSGPYYADVPFAEAGTLSSSRVSEFGNKVADQAGAERGSGKYTDDGLLYKGAFNGFGGNENGHTIATGFAATIEAGSDPINKLTWNITSKPSSVNPVFIRKKLSETDTADAAAFKDGSDETGYGIFRLAENNEWTWHIATENMPEIAGNSTVSVGLVLDQLYDQQAVATITLDDTTQPIYDETVTGAGTKVKPTESIEGASIFKPIEPGSYNFDSLIAQTFETETLLLGGYIKILAASDKTIVIDKAGHTLIAAEVSGDGTSVPYGDALGTYATRLKLGGTGDMKNKMRLVAVQLKKGQSVSVYATSASDAIDRTLCIQNESGLHSEEKLVASGSYKNDNGDTLYKVTVVEYTALEDETVYIYSKKSGINIYEINVTGGETNTVADVATGGKK